MDNVGIILIVSLVLMLGMMALGIYVGVIMGALAHAFIPERWRQFLARDDRIRPEQARHSIGQIQNRIRHDKVTPKLAGIAIAL